MKRVLSGIQPSGQLHLGNYLGAVQNWVKLQHDYESFYSIVDMHAISSIYFQSTKGTDLANGLNQSSRLTAATLIACGLDPDRIFIQSSIPYFAELTWIFGCISPLSWLNRMTQFKDKKQALKGASLGLFSYPVLMAADILAFKAEVIPVGDDQQQHIELARDIAERFNSVFQPTFPLPTPLFSILYISQCQSCYESKKSK